MFHELHVRELHIPFRVAFRHASAERTETSSLWVTAATARVTGYGESCPRPYVTGETVDSARAFCERHTAALMRNVTNLDTLRAWMAAHREAIDANPAAWCAVELALLDAMGKESGQPVEALLGLPPLAGRFQYSAVVGDADPPAFAAMAGRFRQHGFTDFKIKLSGDLARDRGKLALLRAWNLPSLRIRADANNLWADADAAIGFLDGLGAELWAVEEPVRAGRYDDLARIGRALGWRIVLDESLVRGDHLDALSGAPAAVWIVNVRVSKMGGLLRSLDIVRDARARGHGIIVGAQVGETSLLTRAGLTVAAAAGDALVAQEGAFGTMLLEHDVVEPSLMFGAGGALDVADSPVRGGPGFGLEIRAPA